jgi:hypothetical protein
LKVAFGGGAMAVYRMYTVGYNGRLVDAAVIYTSTDEEAMDAAKTRLKENDLEIWTGTRRVGVVKAEPKAG